MAIELKQLYAGGTEANNTTIKARVDLTGGSPAYVPELDVYCLQYEWGAGSTGTWRVYMNGAEVQRNATVGEFPYFINLLIGGDEDNFIGHMAEGLFLKTGFVGIPYGEIQTYTNWLADKWLPTGKVLYNGHTVASTHGTEPTFATTTQQFTNKWLHFDETTIVKTGSVVDNWNDKAAFGAGNKTGNYYNFPTSNKLSVVSGKNGKDLINFNGDNFFKMNVQNAGVNNTNDPAYLTIFFVAQFNDVDANLPQTIFGNVDNTNTSYNNALRVKRYTTSGGLESRVSLDGFLTTSIPENVLKRDAEFNFIYRSVGTYNVTGVPNSSSITSSGNNFQIGTRIIHIPTGLERFVTSRAANRINLNSAITGLAIGDTFEAFEQSWELDTTGDVIVGANLRLVYTKDETFTTDLNYSSTVAISSTNKGIAKIDLINLDSDETYFVKAEINGTIDNHIAKFKTLPKLIPKGYSFIFGSCNNSNSNHPIWDEMRLKNPDAFFHLGDLHYDDIAVNDIDLFRNSFNNTIEQPKQKQFYSNQSNYYIWDDHDFGPNNSDKNSPSREAAIDFYLENVPFRNIINDPETNGISQYYDIGRTRFVMTDLRSNRDDWTMEPYDDPLKTVLGTATKAWFKSLLLDYKANTNLDVLFWMNPFGWSGDENDPYSWSYNVTTEVWTVYLAERQELANFMYYNNIPNVIICNGDTHMIAIDDGRNNFYATDSNGVRIKASSVPSNLQHMIIESSPFDRDGDKQNGPFQIDDSDDSGGPFPIGENNFTLVTVNDLGSSWIEIIVEQFGIFSFSASELFKVREFRKQYQTKRSFNSIQAPPKFKTNYQIDEGLITVPEGVHSTISGRINITAPQTPFNNMWKGPISGTYTGTLSSFLEARLIRRSGEDTFVTLGAVSSTTGNFTLNPPSNFTGTIVIQIRDTEFDLIVDTWINDLNVNSYLSDLQIERFITTDVPYFSGQFINAPSTKEWKLGYTNNEGKISYKLINTSTNDVLANSPIRADLSRSFLIDDNDAEILASPFPSRAYLYDMALVLISATGMKDFRFADRIISGIIESQYSNGAFAFSVNHINPAPELQDPYFRTGAIAWVAYALGYYLQYRLNSPIKTAVQTSLVNVLTYIESLMDNPIGLPTGGKGRYYIDSGSGLELFDAEWNVPWISTEHNIDSYFAFKQAGKVLGSQTYRDIAGTIKDIMLVQLWDGSNNRFFQGISNAATNQKDTADALDCNSWGAIMLFSAGESQKANQLLLRLETYYYVEDVNTGAKGYKPYSSEWGYGGAVDTVWFEGSFGVALSYWRAKNYDKYALVMSDLAEFEEPDGSYRYAALRDEVYQISNYPSTCSTAWFIIASRLKSTVWV